MSNRTEDNKGKQLEKKQERLNATGNYYIQVATVSTGKDGKAKIPYTNIRPNRAKQPKQPGILQLLGTLTLNKLKSFTKD